MINRAAVSALPLTATCKLVTLNDSPMRERSRLAAGLVIWSFLMKTEGGESVKDEMGLRVRHKDLLILTLH